MAGKVEWFKNEFPGEAEKIAKYMMISGYIIGRLSDIPIEEAAIDQTYIQWNGPCGCEQARMVQGYLRGAWHGHGYASADCEL